MSFLKNRTVLGIICIVASLIICFLIAPVFNSGASKKVEIVRMAKDAKAGELITKDMLQTVSVGAFNLPDNIVKTEDTAVGKYLTADLAAGDYIIITKLSDNPALENVCFYNLNGGKQAISVTVKSLASGLSGKLVSGDIVSVIAPDFRKLGVTVIPPELQYVEVIAVTDSSGYDTDTGGETEDKDKKPLPSTVTLLVSPEQSKILAELEADSKLHLSLVYRGTPENAAKFTALQDEVIAGLYAPEDESAEELAGERQNENSPVEQIPENEGDSHD